ncbi:NeuD/PglB/VioB family sugar acetyltransferase [Lewinella sp. IMCC34183]|uniref:NeuD/PglB/VioB family sugar acetyltransferase n=1 Tax=Lewinella sp. IMCC34183 TaxID=2248762 RepID=UPI000E24C7E4|nr:NeuD/PglB/VioB family sugar acetyltransferase [Lewinella sp. IMCC34183]
MEKADRVALLGYSGHAWVVCEALLAIGRTPAGYYDLEPKESNPFHLAYLGTDHDIEGGGGPDVSFFPATGDNTLRRKLTQRILGRGLSLTEAVIHPAATVVPSARIAAAALIAVRATVGTFATVGVSAIINTGAQVDHECFVGAYAHIAPGAILTGNVHVGTGALVGAGAVVLPGIHIGDHATIGAGAVVLRDVPAGATVYGNPAKSRT